MAQFNNELQRRMIEEGLLLIETELDREGSLIDYIDFFVSQLDYYRFEEILSYARKALLSRLSGSIEDKFSRIAVNSKKQERDTGLHARNKISEILTRRFPKTSRSTIKQFVNSLFIPYYNIETSAKESASFEEFVETAKTHSPSDTDELLVAQDRVLYWSRYNNKSESKLTDQERISLRQEISNLVTREVTSDRDDIAEYDWFTPEIEKVFVDYILFRCCYTLSAIFKNELYLGEERPQILNELNVTNLDFAFEIVRTLLDNFGFLNCNSKSDLVIGLDDIDDRFKSVCCFAMVNDPSDEGRVFLGSYPILLQFTRKNLKRLLNFYLSQRQMGAGTSKVGIKGVELKVEV